MWSDNSHSQGFPHAPTLDKLCLHSRLGCVLAGAVRGAGSKTGPPSYMGQVQDPPNLPTTTQISAEAAVFVAVIVVFYAAIIVILLGTNMRRPPSLSSSQGRPRSRSRSRARSRSRHRHQLVLDPLTGAVSTQKKKTRKAMTEAFPGVAGAETV